MSGIQRTLLFFWAAWLSVVVLTNGLDVLAACGMLAPTMKFVSGNWQWINQVMDPLRVPRGLQAVFFAGAIAWEAVAAIIFWRALATYRGRPLALEKAVAFACHVNLALWAAFQVLDEIFIAYQPEGVHRMIFLNQIATLLLLHLLPAPASAGTPEGTS